MVEQVGVETARSSVGTASRASEGEMLRGGEEGRWYGELSVLAGGLMIASSAMFEVRREGGYRGSGVSRRIDRQTERCVQPDKGGVIGNFS